MYNDSQIEVNTNGQKLVLKIKKIYRDDIKITSLINSSLNPKHLPRPFRLNKKNKNLLLSMR